MKFILRKIIENKTVVIGELENVSEMYILDSGENFHFWCVEFEDGTNETFPINEYLLIPTL